MVSRGSARLAGIDKEVGYRFLRDRYLELRREGLSAADAVEVIGFHSSRGHGWEAMVDGDDRRHHLQVDASMERAFWEAFDGGASCDVASRGAGVSRSTGYRWLQRRFRELGSDGVSLTRTRHSERPTHRSGDGSGSTGIGS